MDIRRFYISFVIKEYEYTLNALSNLCYCLFQVYACKMSKNILKLNKIIVN